MAFEPVSLDSEGKALLGRFCSDSLRFQVWRFQASIYCEEENLHFRVPIFLPRQMISAGTSEQLKTFLSSCFGQFVGRTGLKVFPKLSGGGACACKAHHTKDVHSPTLTRVVPEYTSAVQLNPYPETPDVAIDSGLKKPRFSDENQQLAFEIAEEVREFAQKGITTGMRLSTLENLPQVMVKAPYIVAESLLNALHEPALWSLPSDYLVRATIARLARKYMIGHIFLNRAAFFTTVNNELNDVLQEVLEKANLQDKSWPESGVLVQCKALRMLMTSASDMEPWLKSLPPEAKTLFNAYGLKNPLLAIPRLANILEKLGTMVSQKYIIEFQLQVDNVYWTLGDSNPEFIDSAVRSLSELLTLGKSWKNLYAALTCLEWAIHREKFTESQINQLKPHLEALTTINSCSNFGIKGKQWRICEKVATILIKLSQKDWLTDLFLRMKEDERDPRIVRLFRLYAEELYVEPRISVLINVQSLPNFIGRETELLQAKEQLKTSKIVRIVGPSGSGKTALAITFACTLINTFEIVWKCSADSEVNLSSDLKQLATRLKLGDDFSDLITYLNSHQVLLLLDNFDSTFPDEFRALLEGNIRVIITSRNLVQTDAIKIRGLDPSEAVDFVIGLTKRETERQDVESLCRDLSYLPLALKNVSALLNFKKSDRVQQVTQWVKGSPEGLETGSSPRMMLILEECVRKVSSEAGKRLLSIIIDLSPDLIPEQLYKELFAGGAGELTRAKKEAESLSLIQEDDQHNISVHQLIKQAIRNCYSVQALALFPAKVQILLHLFDFKSLSELTFSLFKSINCVINTIKLKELPEPVEVSLFIHFLYFCIVQLGSLKTVTDTCQKCCEWWDQRPKVNSKNVSDLEYLAMCCGKTAQFLKAEQYMTQVIAVNQKGKRKEALGSSYSKFATLYKSQGKLKDAEQYHLKALQIYEAILSPTHLDLATSYTNLALVYQAQRRLQEAEEYNLKALKIYEIALSPTHLTIAASYTSLASVYKAQGKLEESEQYNLKAIQIKESVLPPMHPDLANSYNHLASVYFRQGKTEVAEQVHLKALKIREAVLSPTNPHLAASYSNLATVYKTQGRLAEAEQYSLKALKIYEATLPPAHPTIALLLSNLAVLFQTQGKLAEAEKFLIKSIQIRETALTPTNPDLALSYHYLASVYQAQGNLIKAEEYTQKADK